MTQEQIKELRSANQDRGWAPVPDGCPENIVRQICEVRARRIADETRISAAERLSVNRAKPDTTADDLRQRLAELSL